MHLFNDLDDNGEFGDKGIIDMNPNLNKHQLQVTIAPICDKLTTNKS